MSSSTQPDPQNRKRAVLYSLSGWTLSALFILAALLVYNRALFQTWQNRLADLLDVSSVLASADQKYSASTDENSGGFPSSEELYSDIVNSHAGILAAYNLERQENGEWQLTASAGSISEAGSRAVMDLLAGGGSIETGGQTKVVDDLVQGAEGVILTGYTALPEPGQGAQRVLVLEQSALGLLDAQRRAAWSAAGIFLLTMPVTAVLAVIFSNLAGIRQQYLNEAQAQGELQAYTQRLEQEATERTQALQQANVALSMRAVQLQISSEVARHVSSILELETLVYELARTIQRRYDYYFVGVWLTSEDCTQVILQAGVGREQSNLPAAGFSLPLDKENILGAVCKSGRAQVINDTLQTGKYIPLPEIPGTHSRLVLPIRSLEEVIGVLDLHSDERQAFGGDDINLMQTLCDQTATAIRNAQLYQSEQTRRQLAESLEHIGRELSSSLDMLEVPARILEQLRQVVPYERGSVLLQRTDELEIVAQRGFPEDERASSLRMPIREGDVYQQLLAANNPIWIDDVTQTSGWQQLDWLPVNHSWMGVPLKTQNKVIGMISLTRPQAGTFSQKEADLVLAFAGQAAIALENAALYEEISRFSQRLEKAYENLARLDKAKADFISVAAHELRTPLTVVKGYVQVLESRLQIANDPETRGLLDNILEALKRLQDMINSMLDVSKIDNQTLRMYFSPTWISMVVKRVRSELRSALLERDITLKLEGLEQLPNIQADSELLYKVFYQLVVNAIKFTPDGGRITVSGKTIMEEMDSPAIEIAVSDTGIGIDPAQQELIFEKFYQTGQVSVHSSGKTKFKGGGPGLGLAIARGIVEAHGGKIWVQSSGVDEQHLPGSTFIVRLPVNTQPAASED